MEFFLLFTQKLDQSPFWIKMQKMSDNVISVLRTWNCSGLLTYWSCQRAEVRWKPAPGRGVLFCCAAASDSTRRETKIHCKGKNAMLHAYEIHERLNKFYLGSQFQHGLEIVRHRCQLWLQTSKQRTVYFSARQDASVAFLRVTAG